MEKIRILVVDDEKIVRDALERWFTLQGHIIKVAADGLESLEIVQESPIDIVLMDLEMPRMGGVEATEKIKKLYPDLPILAITGFSEGLQAVLDAGAVKVLSKPLKMRELEAELMGVLKDSARDRESDEDSSS